MDAELLGQRIRLLAGRDVALVHHRVQHLPLAGGRQVGMGDRVPVGGRLGDARQHRGLGQVEVLGVLLEVGMGRRLHAVGLLAVIAVVEVELEDLVLAVALGELVGEDDLLRLPAVGLLGGQEELLGQLLGDRRAATDDLPVAQVVIGGTHDAGDVEAGVAVEVLVLDVDGALDQGGGDLLQGQELAVVAVVADVGELGAAAVVDEGVPAEGRCVEPLHRGQGRQVLLGVDVTGSGRHQHERQQHPEEAQPAVPAGPLPERRPEGVDPGAGPVPARRFKLL